MVGLVSILRLLAVVVVSPIVLVCILVLALLHPVESFRHPLQRPIRIVMSVGDWVQGLPIGYSYWERYQAPAMLDEIEVHHEDSAS